MENWKDIEGYDGYYQVSDLGNVRSKKIIPGWKSKDGIRKCRFDRKGYLTVGLWFDGRYKNELIHRLVAKAFIPNPGKKPEVNHKKGIKVDNRMTELEWNTQEENANHAWKTGLHKAGENEGEKHGMSKLIDRQVRIIKHALNYGASQRILAKMFGVNQSTISFIKTGKQWDHITV